MRPGSNKQVVWSNSIRTKSGADVTYEYVTFVPKDFSRPSVELKLYMPYSFIGGSNGSSVQLTAGNFFMFHSQYAFFTRCSSGTVKGRAEKFLHVRTFPSLCLPLTKAANAQPVSPNGTFFTELKGNFFTGPCTEDETRGQWPYRVASDREMTIASDSKPTTSITLESICILLLKATFMASDSSGLQMTSEVKADLRIELSDLK